MPESHQAKLGLLPELARSTFPLRAFGLSAADAVAAGLAALFFLGWALASGEPARAWRLTFLPVLAWGLGMERLAMINYNIDDLRKIYISNIKWLREVPSCR